MISHSTITSANMLIDSLRYRGKCISPKQSDFKTLYDSIHIDQCPITLDNITDMSNQVNKPTLGDHGAVNTRLTNILHDAVVNIHHTAKNTVLANVNIILGKIKKAKQDHVDEISGDSADVILIETPTLFTDELFLTLLNNFNVKTMYNLELTTSETRTLAKVSGFFTTEELADLLATDNTLLDGRINTTCGRYNAQYFTNFDFNLNFNCLNDKSMDALYLQIALFIIVNNIINVKLEKVHGIEIVGGDGFITLRNKLGTSISNKIDMFMTFIRNKTLIAPYYYVNNTGSEVAVFGKVYRGWLANGGSVYALLGYHNASKEDTTIITDLHTPDGIKLYSDKYNSGVKLAISSIELNEISLTKKILKRHVASLIAELDEDVISSKQKILLDFINGKNYNSIDVESYIIKCLCLCLVERDDVYRFILDTQRILHSDVNPYKDDKAALDYALQLATINLLACWVCERITVSDTNGSQNIN